MEFFFFLLLFYISSFGAKFSFSREVLFLASTTVIAVCRCWPTTVQLRGMGRGFCGRVQCLHTLNYWNLCRRLSFSGFSSTAGTFRVLESEVVPVLRLALVTVRLLLQPLPRAAPSQGSASEERHGLTCQPPLPLLSFW